MPSIRDSRTYFFSSAGQFWTSVIGSPLSFTSLLLMDMARRGEVAVVLATEGLGGNARASRLR